MGFAAIREIHVGRLLSRQKKKKESGTRESETTIISIDERRNVARKGRVL